MYKIGLVTLVTIVVAVACGHDREQASLPPDETDEHLEESIQSTLFTEETEFFVEYDPLTVGEESQFLVHVTDLKTYKPLPSGQLTIDMAGKSVSSSQPATPGIYQIAMIPEEEGEFQITYSYRSDKYLDSVSEQVEVLINELEPDHADHESTAEGEISFLKEEAWKNDFMVLKMFPAPFSRVIHTSGEILAVPGAKKTVSSPGSGMISFAVRNLVQGSSVTDGQILFSINNQAVIQDNLQLQYQESMNNLEKSRSEYLRHQELFRGGAISERAFIATRTKYLSDSLQFQNLASHITDNGLSITAPITGTIHELNVSEGEFVETGRLLATISSNRELLIRADLPQQYFGLLDSIETANFRPGYTEHVYSVNEMNGRLLAAGSTVAENNHYLPVIFEVRNDGSLLEGAYTDVFLRSVVKKETMAVPLSAILVDQGGPYVYVQVTGESYSKRRVITGGNDGKVVEILEGLSPGDRVVSKGAALIKAASMTTVVSSHEHEH